LASLVNASTKPVNFDDMTVRIIKANTVQIMDYYPFGLMWEKQDVTSTDNLTWHHGKELQENEFAQQGKSLDLEDFGARMYDPILEKWWSVDPLAEKFLDISPYNGMGNNPIFFIDPDGRAVTSHDGGNRTVYTDEDAAMALMALQAGEEQKAQQQDTDPPKKEKSSLEVFQGFLDIIGLVPVFGEPADAINGLIYLAQGDNLNAGLSFAAVIPIFGWAATAGKLGVKVNKHVKTADAVKQTASTFNKSNPDKAKYIFKDLTEGYPTTTISTPKGDIVRAQVGPDTYIQLRHFDKSGSHSTIDFIDKKGLFHEFKFNY